MNNYFIPYKIRPVSGKIEIVLILTFAFNLILGIYSNSAKIFKI